MKTNINRKYPTTQLLDPEEEPQKITKCNEDEEKGDTQFTAMPDGTPEGRSTVTTEKNMRKSEHLLLGETQRAPNAHRPQTPPTLKKQPTPARNPRKRTRS